LNQSINTEHILAKLMFSRLFRR